LKSVGPVLSALSVLGVLDIAAVRTSAEGALHAAKVVRCDRLLVVHSRAQPAGRGSLCAAARGQPV
jgi:hypothetical protein